LRRAPRASIGPDKVAQASKRLASLARSAAADYLIDMGPGGGPDGGRILAAGTPGNVARAPGSATGPWLAGHLGLPERRPAGCPVRS
jgi:hypothetical protein